MVRSLQGWNTKKVAVYGGKGMDSEPDILVQLLALTPSSSVALGNSLGPSEFQFVHPESM